MYSKKKIVKVPPKKDEPLLLTAEYKNTICSQSYLGKKGYTIPLSLLSKEDYEYLHKDLYVKPVVMGVQYGAATGEESNAFHVYRESPNKIYIPRFYGIERYGLPSKTEICSGDDIAVEFTKPLRDYQEEIIDIYMKHVRNPLCCGSTDQGNGGILEVPCGAGKCLGKDTKILMFDGSIKLVQDIVVGDILMGDDSTPRNVLSLARGREMMYKVCSSNSEGYIVNESHILSLKTSSYINKNLPKGTVIDIPVLEYLQLPKCYHDGGEPLLGYRVPIQFKEKDVEIDPYLFGNWLGDSSSNGDTSKQEITYSTTANKNNILMNFLRKYNLINNKYIPQHYKCNSRKVQLELLAGLIDSDGYYNQNCFELTHKNETLLDDIIFISRSLGFAAFKTKVNSRTRGMYYRTRIYGRGLEEIPVNCTRKTVHSRSLTRDALKYRIKLEKLEIDDYYGFEIDGNRRFVLDDFTVTHNTVMALKIISLLKKKTIIIVHKEFLMNQWIERIAEFLPTAKIGKIQGPQFDIVDKDIVIGMVQTLYDKEYATNAFSSFGLTIIDEVHRIGSEQFSKTLFKTITPYMLGISATVDRKDKLTRVLYMFIGDKIYSKPREAEDPVCVRAIQYKVDDAVFNETAIDFRGNPKYSTMISKLCDYNRRSDFIVRVIGDLIIEEPEKQIMILGHNRSLLNYLYDAVVHRKIASVGFYIGGMKQEKLQESETKQIVLATYAMAAEALDIKTLSTLVMITPKTDIVQSVGRILRTKHEKPIVVDIVDSHDIFQNQWNQRKRFYKKCNYRIRQIDSKTYTNMSIDWAEDKTWKRIYEPTANTTADCSAGIQEDDEPKSVFGGKCLINISDLS
uniref:Helicase ATP-binding domain-containing protein n=1 Tax=viral metagenome TaxID=1070528 RepID=A0A6C0LU91_9ZZZZ